MDPIQFDRLTRRFASSTGRRGILETLLGIVALGAADASARRRRDPNADRHRQSRRDTAERAPDASPRDRDGVAAEKKHKGKKKGKKCKLKCAGKQCGPSNCKGKTCGSCQGVAHCNARGQCVGCVNGSDCASGTCCSEICCGANERCNPAGQCVECLTNGDCQSGLCCGGSCCAGEQVCTDAGHCCTPNCDGRRCDSDHCGGLCACLPDASCDGNGRCVCNQAGQVVCGGECITAECCAGGVQPGVRCGEQCVPEPLPGLICCPLGRGCTADEECCGHDTSQGTVCFGGSCCQPLGAACAINTPCCEGFCDVDTCTACTDGLCCTDNEPGCPQEKECCGATCINTDACCTSNVPGCPQGQKCCGGTCIAVNVCCTDGTPDTCPADRACIDGRCDQCGQPPAPVCEAKPCTASQCIDGDCVYFPSQEGAQCLQDGGETGSCCNGVCSGCCHGNPATCPPPGTCRFKGCADNQCTPVDAPDGTDPNNACGSGVCCSGACCNTLCCDGLCCPDGKDKMECSAGLGVDLACCYLSGVTMPIDSIYDCCSDVNVGRKCL